MIESIHKIKLNSIGHGGEAIGRLENGKCVFIEGGSPDDTVMCRITQENKSYARAELLEIIEPSSQRIAPACKHYGVCGGCNLMHIDYESQLEVKKKILLDSFSKINGIEIKNLKVVSSSPFEYRNRMQFHCLRDNIKYDEIKFGLKAKKSNEIIPVTECSVAVKGIQNLIYRKGEGIELPKVTDRFNIFSYEDWLLNEGGIERGVINLLNKEIKLDASVFFQSNIKMLEKLIIKLKEIINNIEKNLPMADLYSGVGTFSVFLGEDFPKVILAEENKKAIALANENLKNINKEFYALKDSNWEQLLNKNYNLGFAVIDPPRAGLNNKTAQILALKGPPVLTYVSCDVSSLARDSGILIKGGYKLKEIFLYDFYPQTSHIETLSVFTK